MKIGLELKTYKKNNKLFYYILFSNLLIELYIKNYLYCSFDISDNSSLLSALFFDRSLLSSFSILALYFFCMFL